MKDDMISKQAAIKSVCTMLKNCFNATDEMLESVKITVGELPPAQRWIPVTERLPKPNEYENGVRVYYLVQNEYGDMMVCSWHGSFWTRMYRNTSVKDRVVAWMPLPKQWKGGQDEQN